MLRFQHRVQCHGVTRFLASTNIHGTFKANWFVLFVKAILSFALWEEAIWFAASECCPQMILLFLIMPCTADTMRVDRVDLTTPLLLSSQPATGLSAPAPAAGWSAAISCLDPERNLDLNT